MFMSITKVIQSHCRPICVVSVELLLHSLGSACPFFIFFNGNIDFFLICQSQKVKVGFERKMSINKEVKYFFSHLLRLFSLGCLSSLSSFMAPKEEQV